MQTEKRRANWPQNLIFLSVVVKHPETFETMIRDVIDFRKDDTNCQPVSSNKNQTETSDCRGFSFSKKIWQLIDESKIFPLALVLKARLAESSNQTVNLQILQIKTFVNIFEIPNCSVI